MVFFEDPEVLAHVTANKILIQPGCDHERRIRSPGQDVIPADLFGAFPCVRKGSDRDTPQILYATQVGDILCQVLTATVGSQAESLKDCSS